MASTTHPSYCWLDKGEVILDVYLICSQDILCSTQNPNKSVSLTMNYYYFAVTGSHVEAEKNSSGTGSPLLPESAGGGSQVYSQQKHHSPWSETGQHAAEWKDATQNRRFWISHKNDIRRRKENVGFLFSWMHFWNLFDRVSDNWWVTLKK